MMAKWFLLRVGLPVGFLVAVWPGLIGAVPTLADIVVTAGVTGLVLSAGLSAVTAVFLRFSCRSRGSFVMLGMLLAAGTVAGGIIALDWNMRLPHGRWVRLPDPPEQPQAFVGPGCLGAGPEVTRLFVVMPSGRYLGYGFDPAMQHHWTMQSTLPAEAPSDRARCERASLGRPPPRIPQDVVAVHRVVQMGVDCGGTTYYLLRPGGSVWTWSNFSCALIPSMLFLGYCVIVRHPALTRMG